MLNKSSSRLKSGERNASSQSNLNADQSAQGDDMDCSQITESDEDGAETGVSRNKSKQLSKITLVETVEEEPAIPKFIQVAILKGGNSFGELALIQHKPRAATITCRTDCKFAVLVKKDYQKVLGKKE